MRGDSLRDLYAKGLALVGLGLLAGAGALVDYWPTRGALPAVATPRRPDLTVQARPVPADWLTAAAQPSAPRIARRSIAAPMPSIRVTDPSIEFAEALALLTLTPPPPALPAPVAVLASTVPAADGDLLLLPPPTTPAITAEVWSADVDDQSFFLTGAVKRTGASILRTSARTGASIVDAMRTVGGAVRRALPN